MEHSFQSDQRAPSPNPSHDEVGVVAECVNQSARDGSEIAPGEVSLDEPGCVDLAGQPADLLSFVTAAASRDRQVTGGSSLPQADHTDAGASAMPPAPASHAATAETPLTPGLLSAIYENLLAACEPIAAAGPFERTGPPVDARRGTADPIKVLDTLRALAADQDLRDAGVLTVDSHGRDCLHPDLAQPASPWLALRDHSGRVFDVVGPRGCLRQSVPALAAMMQDAAFREALSETRIVFVVFDLEEMLWLLAHRFPATTAAGLSEHSANLAFEIEDLLNGKLANHRGGDLDSFQWVECLCLVGWSILRADPTEPPDCAKVRAELLTWREKFGVDLDRVRLCRPRPEDLQLAKRAVRRGDPNELEELMVGLADMAEPLVVAPVKPPPPKPSLAELLEQQLQEALVAQSLSDAERQRRRLLFQIMIKPLIEQAEAQLEADPLAANVLLTAAWEFQKGSLHLPPPNPRPWSRSRGARRTDEASPTARQLVATREGRAVAGKSAEPVADARRHSRSARILRPDSPTLRTVALGTVAMRTLDLITELALSHEDLQALARQGFVATQRRGARITYKLRFRRGRKQQVRCLGSEPERAAEIEAALWAWQTPRRLKQELRTLVVAGRALRRSIRPRLREHAARAGFKFHGRRLRKPRSAVPASPEPGSSCRE